MKTKLVIQVESHDMTRLDQIEQALSLVGGSGLRAPDPRSLHPEPLISGFTIEDAKVFGRIRGNSFSEDDASHALECIKRRAAELKASLNEPVFSDKKIQAGWANGINSTTDLAVRLATDFFTNLITDLDNEKNHV